MNGWMDRQTDEWWLDSLGGAEGLTDPLGCACRQTDVLTWMDGQMDWKMDEWNGWMNEWAGQMDGQMDRLMNGMADR